jgi:hypothetical protein
MMLPEKNLSRTCSDKEYKITSNMRKMLNMGSGKKQKKN